MKEGSPCALLEYTKQLPSHRHTLNIVHMYWPTKMMTNDKSTTHHRMTQTMHSKINYNSLNLNTSRMVIGTSEFG